uniref:Uncharacterized protein n=1 Tax=Oryza brachyantha TaxID=4533 RepID=J3M4W1_ORYBR
MQALRDLQRERGEHHRRLGRRRQGVHAAVARGGGGHGRRPGLAVIQGVQRLLQGPVILQSVHCVLDHCVHLAMVAAP